MDHFEQLADFFSRFPGIGKRQGRRFAYHIARQNKKDINTLTTLIEHVSRHMKRCSESCALFYTENQEETLSPIAKDTTRDRSTILLVEKDADLEAIERSGVYHGTYFVLGGAIPVLDDHPERVINITELQQTITKRSDEIKEVIMALSVTPQGENTEEYVKTVLQPLQKKYGFAISRLGRGVSTGTEVEYSDAETLKNALNRRTE